jgi:hypothetical protein
LDEDIWKKLAGFSDPNHRAEQVNSKHLAGTTLSFEAKEHLGNNSWFLLKAILDASSRTCGTTGTRREKELMHALWIRARRWVGAPAESNTIRDKVALPLTTKT